MSYAVQLTIKSRNVKVGAMPVSTTAAKTCPLDCPLNVLVEGAEGGCYAQGGPLGMMWRALSTAVPGEAYALPKGKGQSLDWNGFTAAVSAFPAGTVWRHNQAGDLPGEGNKIDLSAMRQLVDANKGKRGFTYTHKPIAFADNRVAIDYANLNGFTVNLSANTLAHADALSAENIGPVVVVLPVELERGATKAGEWTEELPAYRARIASLATPEGRKVAVCPATYSDNVSCATCQLCQRVDRKVIVGFPAHGASKRKASKVAEASA